MQDQVDRLAAQLAGDYYGGPPPPIYPDEPHDSYHPDSLLYYVEPPPPERRSHQSSNSSQERLRREISRSPGSHGSARSRGASRRGPYDREPQPERRIRAPEVGPRSRSPARWRYVPPQDHVPYNPERPVIAPEDIAARIARLEGALVAPTAVPAGNISPFFETLEAAPVNPGVKITGLESYDGTSDPNNHLSYYENPMVCHRYNDITCCRLFVSTFKAYARTWFSCLPPRSIHSWGEFKAVFLAKFRINIPQAVYMVSLENIKQTRGESLRSYIERFKTTASKVRDLRTLNQNLS